MALTTMKYKYIGVDLASDKLDICVADKFYHYTNDDAGIKKLLSLVRKQGENSLVVYESTGYISRRFASVLFEHNVAQKCLNPAWVYYYARSKGKHAKNDRLDSYEIYNYAVARSVTPDHPYNQFVLELREMVAARKLLLNMRKALKCACYAYNGRNLQRIEKSIAALDEQITAQEKEIQAFIMAHEQYGALYKELRNQPGIGKVLSMTLIAYLPELGKVSSKEISAIVGLAPYDHESGNMKGRRCISGGRSLLRNELYMVGTACLRLQNWRLRDFYEKISAKRPHKVAMIACCRRFIVQLNAKVRDWYKNGCVGALPMKNASDIA